jgi:imidazolonepropionase-like amidohydrolase
VRGATRIEALDLASGRTRVVASPAQRDQQEGFGMHGLFPGFAWTPDSRALVATDEGRLWRFDAASGARTPIPFVAHVEQVVNEALRFPRRVGEGDVRARVIRWPAFSPDGSRAVFSALGSLYVLALPGATPERVTRGEAPEYAPGFAPNGREIAYVTWDDREGGHVWRRSLGGLARATQVTRVPGQYANPAFSPDGSKLVFVQGTGATWRGQDLVDELRLELRWAPAKGGESRYVRSLTNRGAARRMARPQFSPDGERIFFTDEEEGEKPGDPPTTLLQSVKLDGTDLRSHLRFARAQEVAISPDGRHVAFVEDHDAWLTVLPAKPGDPIEMGAENPALPLARLSNEGGEWVGFSDGGATVSWALGPTLHRVAVDVALRPREAPRPGEEEEEEEEPEPPPAERFAVQLAVPRAKPSEVVAYAGARIVTMQGDRVIEEGVLLVNGDRIEAVGARGEVAAPVGARVVDVSGKTIIPGLFDEHAHLHYSTLDILPRQPWKYAANLAYGVTSAHDVSATTHESFAQSELVEAGRMIGPRIFTTGEVLYAGAGPGFVRIASLEDARRHVRRLKQYGAFTVKSYGQPARNARQWILRAAREEQVMVVPEGEGELEFDVTMILDGHTTVEHALPIAPLRKDVVTLFARSGTAYTPTLLVAYGGLEGDRWFHQHYELWKDERLARFVPQEIVDRLGRIRSVMATDPADWHHLAVAASARDVLRAGGRVNLGGHGQMQGLGPHWEMWAFVQAGMTPLEALRVATLNPAQTLGLDRDLGSLEPGKLADFAVLDANPLERIENSERVSLVVKNGVAYRPEELALPR